MTQWIQNAPAQALGWSLVQFLWEGALVAALLWLALRSGRAWNSRQRYAAAAAALLALPVLFAITVATAPRPAAQIFHQAAAVDLSVRLPGASGPVSPPPASWRDGLAWLTPVWIAGVLLFYVRSAGGWFAACRFRRIGAAIPSAEWLARFERLRSLAGIRIPVTLIESSLAEIPVVLGLLRPVILVPAGLFTGLTPGQLEAILVHELEHIRRFDSAVNLLQSAIEGLLFYHPAVWWISSVVRAEREHCCDDAAVAYTGDPRGYAAALAGMEEGRLLRPALAANGGNLVNRIRRILNVPETPAAAPAPVLFAAIVLVLSAVAVAGWQAPAQNTPSSLPAGSAYEKWLKEDVVYIITNEERAAFERLQTDPEREHFIEQFWLRRDPTPGTPENEFKQEHYRRIAYANQRFGFESIAGWKTDRGRVYIVHGPADEIESHPSRGEDAWLYHRIEGLGANIQFGFEGPEKRLAFYVDAQGRKLRFDGQR